MPAQEKGDIPTHFEMSTQMDTSTKQLTDEHEADCTGCLCETINEKHVCESKALYAACEAVLASRAPAMDVEKAAEMMDSTEAALLDAL